MVRIENFSFMRIFRHILSIPFIYMMIIPAVLMHIFLEIYHQVCFRLYNIPRVNSKDYFHYDRELMMQLNLFQKFNCIYCSYFNCLVAYLQEIAARTERYWCPLKYKKKHKMSHSQYEHFLDKTHENELGSKWHNTRLFNHNK